MSIAYAADDLKQRFPDAESGLGFARFGEALRREGRSDEALPILENGITRHPKYLPGHLALAACYQELGRLDKARSSLETALRIDPRCPAAHKRMAEVLEGLSSQKEALNSLSTLLDLDPGHLDARATYGRLMARKAKEGAAAPLQSIPEFSIDQVADYLPRDASATMAMPIDELKNFESPELLPSDSSLSDWAAGSPSSSPELDAGMISGKDVEDSLDNLFGERPTQAQLPEVTATGSSMMAADLEPPPTETNIYLPPGEDVANPTVPGALSLENRVQGSDIERRLDDLFSLTGAESGASQSSQVFDSTSWMEPEVLAESNENSGETTFATPLSSETTISNASVTGDDVVAHMDTLFGDTLHPKANSPFSFENESDLTAKPVSLTETSFASAAITTEDLMPQFGDQFEEPTETNTPLAKAEELTGTSFTNAFNAEATQMDGLESAFLFTAKGTGTGSTLIHLDAPSGDATAFMPSPGSGEESSLLVLSDLEENLSKATSYAELPPTGDEISAQLDRLFGDDDSEGKPPSATDFRQSETDLQEVLDDLGTSEQPALTIDVIPGEDERTISMPAMQMPIEEDMEATAPSATMFLAAENMAPEEDVVETVDMRPISETQRYDQDLGANLGKSFAGGGDDPSVDGDDISARLDELFGSEGDSPKTPRKNASFFDEVPMGIETDASDLKQKGHSVWEDPQTETLEMEIDERGTTQVEAMTGDLVSGDDVQARMTEIFGNPDSIEIARATTGVSRDLVNETEESMDPLSPEVTSMLPLAPVSQSLSEADVQPAFLSDNPPKGDLEESDVEGTLGEGEIAESGAEPPNIATVTLAEIYFNQGLKEQALQIYRQLFEREPENEKVRARIEEIEASIKENEAKNSGGDSDRLAPRPGMKVPRRKR